MKVKFRRSWAKSARLLGLFVTGCIFSFTFFQVNPASANWARALSDKEMDKVFAAGTVRFKWSTRIKFAHPTSGVKFDFKANGIFFGIAKKFKADAHLLGGLVTVSTEDGNNGPLGSDHSGPIEISVKSSGGPTLQTDGFTTSNGSVEVSVSTEGTGGSGGNVKLTFGGDNHPAGQSIVSFSSQNIDSQIGVNISLVKSNIASNSGIGGRIRGIVAETVRRSLCLGCPP